ncbi:hypothetical protein F4814DRAFT_453777 [Daldinia grandis]|nr:hypothetical protein F4814DRAFT_453777 [Daldinia grandis]
MNTVYSLAVHVQSGTGAWVTAAILAASLAIVLASLLRHDDARRPPRVKETIPYVSNIWIYMTSKRVFLQGVTRWRIYVPGAEPREARDFADETRRVAITASYSKRPELGATTSAAYAFLEQSHSDMVSSVGGPIAI